MGTFLLTQDELTLVNNSDWLLSKHRIIQKVYTLFGDLSITFGKRLTARSIDLPGEIFTVPPKIYKGEQYRQLPYVMLDQPRYFNRSDTFAIRNLFWWGNHFSIHLVLGGKFKITCHDKVARAIQDGKLQNWHLGVSPDPWQHHFESDNYRPLLQESSLPAEDTTQYLKLGRFLPLVDWERADEFYHLSYEQLLDILS